VSEGECGVTCLVTLPHVFVNKAVSIDQPVVMWTIQSTPNPHDWRLEKMEGMFRKDSLEFSYTSGSFYA